MTSKTMEGGCGCGAVRYRLTDEPFIVHNCHCSLCQRQTGTGSAVNAFIESDRLEHVSGELSETEFATGSGASQTVVRCAKCRTPVWGHYPQLGRKVAAVRVGTLDDPSAAAPDVAIYVADKPSWAPLPANIPAFDAFYNPAEVYSEESLARLKAVIAQ
ncbi:MAG TPA: GFA family protein [Sphingomicrobium sp.]